MTQILFKNINLKDLHTMKVYEEQGGYQSLKKAFDQKPDEIIDAVKASGLRGRGGAGFPTGLKWSFLAKDVFPRYLCCNADESEPGTCKDRELLLKNPHSLLEGMILCSYACRIETGYIYMRGEFHDLSFIMDKAIEEAHAKGYLGKNIMGTGFDLEIYTHLGAGAYICGEESALLNSLEGGRGEPRMKPPFPAVEGLYAKPTVINNVETLCVVPYVVNEGAEKYAALGTEKSKGTKLVSVSGHVKKPGNYEVVLGTSTREIIYDLAGGIRDDNELKAFIPGGSSVPMLPADQVDVGYDYESLAAAGTMLGSGALIVIDNKANIVETTLRLISFYMHESCGKCTPCREGTRWLHQIVERILQHKGELEHINKIEDICDNMSFKAFCPLADACVAPVMSSIKHFRSEYEEYFKNTPVGSV
ncbi:MAG: NADH-quinone oxidoreductase subunit NuoF [Nitrospinaceae bacterium]|jgi:NADH-quinone oxidoreductase subunit F|nr:NADH-quinone oxidoreductase subunit NuoF [Nitrospinaceae bacterium]|tara:strand:+ start:601 stop:1857 length:1257 start_codon:yes stop_codon:yes gene_type:complete